jgi:opacity protein-like surface antigen
MRHIKKFALIGLLLASYSAFCVTPAEGCYVGLIGGATFTPSMRFRRFEFHPRPFAVIPEIQPITAVRLDNTHINYGVGGNLGIQGGTRICNFRFEGELLFNYSPFSSIRTNALIEHPLFAPFRTELIDINISGHVTPFSPFRMSGRTLFGAGLFNVYYDFYDEDCEPTFIPYVGLGVGYAYVSSSLTLSIPYFIQQIVPPPLPVVDTNIRHTISRNSSAPIGQAIVGISYYFCDTSALSLDYRYLSTNTISGFNSRLQAHTINLSFNYWFADP